MKFLGYLLCISFVFVGIQTSLAQNSNHFKQDLKLTLKPHYNGKILTQDQWFVTSNRDSIQVSTLKFYLTNFSYLNASNETVKITASDFLIDAFDTGALVLNLPGASSKNTVSITCSLGVDESLHTAGALAGALDPIHGMYWAWQSGFINFKLEGISPSSPARKNKFQFHIGGYQAPYTTTHKLIFNDIQVNNDEATIYLDIAPFFDNLQLENTYQIMIPGKDAYDLSLKLP